MREIEKMIQVVKSQSKMLEVCIRPVYNRIKGPKIEVIPVSENSKPHYDGIRFFIVGDVYRNDTGRQLFDIAYFNEKNYKNFFLKIKAVYSFLGCDTTINLGSYNIIDCRLNRKDPRMNRWVLIIKRKKSK